MFRFFFAILLSFIFPCIAFASDAVQLLNSVQLTPKITGIAPCDQLVEQTLAKITTPQMTTYEKVKACYDYLITTCSYGGRGHLYLYRNNNLVLDGQEIAASDGKSVDGAVNAYEMLKEHAGVCDDYSCAFAAMVRRIGLNCYTVGGLTARADSGMTGHVWCVINIGGKEYVFDPQIDDNIAKGGPTGYYRFCKTYAEVPGSYADMKVKGYFVPFSNGQKLQNAQSNISTNELPKFFERHVVKGQSVNVLDDDKNTTYFVTTPGMTQITGTDGIRPRITFTKAGEVYMLVREGDKPLYFWVFIVEDKIGNIDREATIKHDKIFWKKTENNPINNTDKIDYAKQVLSFVNQERQKVGAAPLKLSDELMKAAAIRADEITVLMSHTRPNGKPCQSLIENGEYTVGENIAAGVATPEEVVKLWMNSPGHRSNILNTDYEEFGVGYTYKGNSSYKYYWVQMFKRPMHKAMR